MGYMCGTGSCTQALHPQCTVLGKGTNNLDVSVYNVASMKILKPRNYLLEKFATFFFPKPAIFDDMLEQLTTSAEFHHQIYFIGCVNHLPAGREHEEKKILCRASDGIYSLHAP